MTSCSASLPNPATPAPAARGHAAGGRDAGAGRREQGRRCRAAGGAGYVPAWHASPARLMPVTGFAWQSPIVDRTLRLVIHPHTSGDTVRVRLSNRFGEARSHSVRSMPGSSSRVHVWRTAPIVPPPSAGGPP